MRKIFTTVLLMAILAVAVYATDIIPVKLWPTTVHLDGKTHCNPNIETCVKAGYRLLTPKPVTPIGKRIKSEKIIQDPNDETKCKYDIVYEDIPPSPIPPPPEVLTNVVSDRCVFVFTTNGSFRNAKWMDAPVTNVVEE